MKGPMAAPRYSLLRARRQARLSTLGRMRGRWGRRRMSDRRRRRRMNDRRRWWSASKALVFVLPSTARGARGGLGRGADATLNGKAFNWQRRARPRRPRAGRARRRASGQRPHNRPRKANPDPDPRLPTPRRDFLLRASALPVWPHGFRCRLASAARICVRCGASP